MFCHGCSLGWTTATQCSSAFHCIQSSDNSRVMNSAASRCSLSQCSTTSVCYSAPASTSLGESSAADRVQIRCTRVHCLHGTAPPCLADELHRSADSEARQRLRSASSSLIVGRTRLSTVGDRAFPVAGPRVRNAPSKHPFCCFTSCFRNLLKTYLFRRCYIR